MPQNLKYRLIGDGRKVAIAEAADERNIQVHNPSLSEYDVEPTDFLSNDSAISLFLFMPFMRAASKVEYISTTAKLILKYCYITFFKHLTC